MIKLHGTRVGLDLTLLRQDVRISDRESLGNILAMITSSEGTVTRLNMM